MAVPNMIVTLVANVSKFSSGMSKASRQLGGFGKFAGKVLGGFAGLLAGTAIAFGKFAGDAIQKASDLEQAVGGTEAVFGKFAKQMEKASESAAVRMGLSMEQYQRLGAMTGTLLKKAGLPLETLAGKTDTLLTLASDLSATFGGTVEEAATAMNAALRGEFEPIRRFGIALSQAQINERALHDTRKKGESSLTKSEKLQAAYNLLLEQGADASGQFARESDTLQNRQQVLAAKWENISATLGEKMLPFAEAFVGVLTGMLDDPKFRDMLNRMVEEFKKFGEWIVSPEGKDAIEKLVKVLKLLFDILVLVGGAIGNYANAWKNANEQQKKFKTRFYFPSAPTSQPASPNYKTPTVADRQPITVNVKGITPTATVGKTVMNAILNAQRLGAR